MSRSYSKSNIYKVFLSLLPAQIFSVVTSSLSGIVNGIVIGRFLTNLDMIALGFISPVNQILGAISAIVSSGSRILCGQYIGRGEKNKVEETFSAAMYLLIGIAIILTVLGLLIATPISMLLGASADSLTRASAYLRGISIGIIPTIVSPCLMVFLQMENDSNYALLSTIVLAVVNFVLSFIVMRYITADIFVVGLITSISQYITMFMLIARFLHRKELPRIRKVNTKSLYRRILVIGLPSALAQIFYGFRNTRLNKIALAKYGDDAVNALSILVSSSGPYDAFNVGLGATQLMLASVYVGEKDRDAIKQLCRVAVVCGLFIAFGKMAFTALFTEPIARLYGASDNVVILVKELYFQYSLSAPLNMITQTLINTYQALKRIAYCNIILFLTALAIPIPYVLLATKVIGITGIWSCYWVSEVVTLLIMYAASCVHKKGVVHGFGDMLHVEDYIDLETSKTISIKLIEDVTIVSREIELFCSANGIDKKRSMLTGLCCEEVTANIFEHGFTKCKTTVGKSIDIYVGISNDNVNVRIKDNAVPFDPHIKLNNDDPTSNIGIKMVSKIAKEMNYQNDFGLNVLTIKL